MLFFQGGKKYSKRHSKKHKKHTLSKRHRNKTLRKSRKHRRYKQRGGIIIMMVNQVEA